MSTLSALLGIGTNNAVKSVQTGYVSGLSTSSGSGEDVRYRDVTINSVTPANCITIIQADSALTSIPDTARVTSSTNLRLSSRSTPSTFTCRWYVVEYTV